MALDRASKPVGRMKTGVQLGAGHVGNSARECCDRPRRGRKSINGASTGPRRCCLTSVCTIYLQEAIEKTDASGKLLPEMVSGRASGWSGFSTWRATYHGWCDSQKGGR